MPVDRSIHYSWKGIKGKRTINGRPAKKKKIHKKTEVKGKKKEPEILGVRKKRKKKKTVFSKYRNYSTFKLPLTSVGSENRSYLILLHIPC
jgi:hypothetical protein